MQENIKVDKDILGLRSKIDNLNLQLIECNKQKNSIMNEEEAIRSKYNDREREERSAISNAI